MHGLQIKEMTCAVSDGGSRRKEEGGKNLGTVSVKAEKTRRGNQNVRDLSEDSV